MPQSYGEAVFRPWRPPPIVVFTVLVLIVMQAPSLNLLGHNMVHKEKLPFCCVNRGANISASWSEC